MTDLLVTPWSHSRLAPPRPALRFDPSRLAVPGGDAAGAWGAGDPLSCPWSGVALSVPDVAAVRALPTLGPDLPVQRVPGVDASVPV